MVSPFSFGAAQSYPRGPSGHTQYTVDTVEEIWNAGKTAPGSGRHDPCSRRDIFLGAKQVVTYGINVAGITIRSRAETESCVIFDDQYRVLRVNYHCGL
jgi:hypothetical protein